MRLVTCLGLWSLPFLAPASARPGVSSPASIPHSLNRPLRYRRDGHGKGQDEGESPAAECNYGQDVSIKAPRQNIFQGLTSREYAEVTAYLHEQQELNLTAIVNSTA